MTTRTDTKTAELVAELAVLERYDAEREIAGHDYGAGQRAAELMRRRRALEGVDRGLPTDRELVFAFEKVARPRIARITREAYRKTTPATKRTLETWRKLEVEYEAILSRLEQSGELSSRYTVEQYDGNEVAKGTIEREGRTGRYTYTAPTGFDGHGYKVVDNETGEAVHYEAWRVFALHKVVELEREGVAAPSPELDVADLEAPVECDHGYSSDCPDCDTSSPIAVLDKAAQHRAAAADHARKADESFERSDTDGFVTQWAHGIMGDLERRKASIAENGGVSDFDVLVNEKGEVVPSRVVDTRYGTRRVIDAENVVGSGGADVWLSRTYARKVKTERARKTDATDRKLDAFGLRYMVASHPAIAKLDGKGRGLSGTAWVATKAVCATCDAFVTIGEPCREGHVTPYTLHEPDPEPINVYLDDATPEGGE